jgi:translation initiation factor 2B subunit (eIF-2B alpha/beta/delta family)
MENSNKIGKILKDIEDIDIIKELKRKLRRKKDLNSTCASEQVAQLFYDLIQDLLQKGDITTQSHLLSLVEYLGKVFISLDPVQFCIGNTIKKILHIIREEINESKKDKKLNLKEQKELIIKAKNNIKKLKDFEIF